LLGDQVLKKTTQFMLCGSQLADHLRSFQPEIGTKMRLSGRRREERIRFVQQGRDTDPFHVVLGKFKFWEGWLGIEFDN
jgi:hypothetical protein